MISESPSTSRPVLYFLSFLSFFSFFFFFFKAFQLKLASLSFVLESLHDSAYTTQNEKDTEALDKPSLMPSTYSIFSGSHPADLNAVLGFSYKSTKIA